MLFLYRSKGELTEKYFDFSVNNSLPLRSINLNNIYPYRKDKCETMLKIKSTSLPNFMFYLFFIELCRIVNTRN